MRAGERRPARGFTFVAVLLLLAVLMAGLAQAGTWWSQDTRRDRERELLRIGTLYASALAAYHDRSPGNVKHYPQQLDELVRDTRFIGTVRHLRRLYADPLDPTRPWGLVRDERGGIVGVFSQSEAAPATQRRVESSGVVLPPASRYSDWKFVAPTSRGPS